VEPTVNAAPSKSDAATKSASSNAVLASTRTSPNTASLWKVASEKETCLANSEPVKFT